MYSNPNAMNTALMGAYLSEEDKKRRESEVAPRQDNLLDTIGKIALAAGATAGAVVAGKRIARANPEAFDLRNARQRVADIVRPGATKTGATVDLSGVDPNFVYEFAGRTPRASSPPQVDVTPSRPAPTTQTARQAQAENVVRQARAERPQGIVLTDLPQPKTYFDPWTKRETITDPFGTPTVPPGPNIKEMSFVLGDLPEPTEAELAQVLGKQTERTYPLTPLTRKEAIASVAAKPESELPRVYRPDSGVDVELITDPNTGEIFRRGKSPDSFSQQYLKQAGYSEADTLVDQQVSSNLNQVDQFVNAVNSAEDQQTGRVKLAFQRNEDENLAAIELAEDRADARLATLAQASPESAGAIEVDAAINTVASQRPDGMPVDQAEGTSSAQRFLSRERDEIASQLGEQGLTPTPGRIDAELARRLGSSASEYGPQYSARRQSLELFAQTGDPKLLNRVQRFGMTPATFETFENMPAEKRAGFEVSAPFSTEYYPSEDLSAVGLSSNIEINLPGRGKVSLADIRKPVVMEDTALAAENYYQQKRGEALDWLGDLRVQLEPKRNEILKERRILAEQSAQKILPQLEAARQAGEVQTVEELEGQLKNLRNLWQNPELGSHRADEYRLLTSQIKGAQKKIGESISQIQKKYPTTLSDWSGEAGRVFGEVDPNTGEFIPETMELRAERRAADLPQKGGGGRNVAEFTAGERIDEELRAIQGGGRIRDYDPETGGAVSPWTGDNTQTGRTIDEYGIRLSGEKPANPELRPSQPQYTKAEIADEAMRLASSAPEGDVPLAPDYDAVIESLGSQPKTETAMRSVLMSEAIRKAERMRAGRNPRGGVLPDEITRLRTQMGQLEGGQGTRFGPRPIVAPGTTEPQQLGLKGISGYAARQRKSEADVAAEQLDAYLSKLQRGRSTPLTSQAVIQPRLF